VILSKHDRKSMNFRTHAPKGGGVYSVYIHTVEGGGLRHSTLSFDHLRLYANVVKISCCRPSVGTA
jgi:hypothetical protein